MSREYTSCLYTKFLNSTKSSHLFVFLNFFKETLAKELDFENEADNSVQCSTDLSDLGTLDKNGSVHVPWVDRKLTSKRVLTAEFIDGIKINQVSDICKAYVF